MYYDARGLLLVRRGPDGAVEFERDALGRVIAEHQRGPDGITRTLRRQYDILGHLQRLEAADGSAFDLSFDALGQRQGLQLHGTAGSHAPLFFSYDAAGQEILRATMGRRPFSAGNPFGA